MRRTLLLLLLIATLQGCTALPFSLTGSTRPSLTEARTIFVASSRKRQQDDRFGDERSLRLSLARYEVFLPPDRTQGSVPASLLGNTMEYPSTETGRMASLPSFARQLIERDRNYPAPAEVLVFVHGFNSTFEHSMSRMAQMDNDFEFPAASVLYAWPSASSLISYVHDLDSTTFARDGLIELLNGLARSDISRIVIVGHSMGARLAMEAVREMRLANRHRFFDKLGGIALLSPDIDLDLFKAQLTALKDITAPVVAYVSPSDATLRDFSDILTEGKPRLGNLKDPRLLDGLPATIIDVEKVNDAAQTSHLALATSPVLIHLINSMKRPDIIRFATAVSEGNMPGTSVVHAGRTTYVQLPPNPVLAP